MEVIELDIKGLLLIKPRIFEDPRGYFFESYNEKTFKAATGLSPDFVQDNESKSEAGVLRGLHLQLPPYEQGKLVRVSRGRVYDVAVDVRKDSPTYGKHIGIDLSDENKHQLYIPPGFAHGFCVRENDTVFSYKCTGHYNRESERSIRWDDPVLNINWGIVDPVVSDKDRNNSVLFSEFKEAF